MNQFTIKDIENLSGIKAHTLRIWEKRYGIITPKRKQSKHRFYDNDDLKNILRITHLYNSGYKISAIANMEDDEMFANELKTSYQKESRIKKLLEATLDLDEPAFNKVLEKAISDYGLEETMVEIIYPYLFKIGLLWINNEALPAQERFASNIIVKKIVVEIDNLELSFNKDLPAIVLFAPVKEHHEIPLLFMHYLLKKSRYKIFYIGTNVDFDTLKMFLELNKVDVLFFHVLINLTNNKIENYVAELCERFSNYKIVMSGRLTANISAKAKNLHLLQSLDQMISFGKNAIQFIN